MNTTTTTHEGDPIMATTKKKTEETPEDRAARLSSRARKAWTTRRAGTSTPSTARTVQRVNVDFPPDLLQRIDQEANRIGVTRQAFIKVRLADLLTVKEGV